MRWRGGQQCTDWKARETFYSGRVRSESAMPVALISYLTHTPSLGINGVRPDRGGALLEPEEGTVCAFGGYFEEQLD